MELKTYNTIVATLSEWDKDQKPYFFEIGWEGIDEPGRIKSWTAGTRETGVSKFSEAVEKISKFPNCHKIHFTAYSGKTGKKEQLREVIKVSESFSSYPVFQERHDRTKEQQPTPDVPPQPQTNPSGGMDLVSSILGFDLNGLNGFDKVNGLLAFRDKQLETRFTMMDKERELATLVMEKKSLEEKLQDANEELEDVLEENEALKQRLDALGLENERLQKYVPENTALGVSLTAIGTAALNGLVKRIALGSPDKVAKLLGTDVETLKGVFAPELDSQPTVKPSAATPSPVSVEVVESENLTPERKQEVEVINHIADWMKTLDRRSLAMVQDMCNMWFNDIETLTQIHTWATGGKKEE